MARRPLRRSVTALGRPVHARGRGDVEGRRFAPRSYVHFYATCVCLFPASRFPRRAAAIQYVPFVPRRLAFVCQAPGRAPPGADEGRARPFTGPFTYTFGYVALYFRDGVVSRRVCGAHIRVFVAPMQPGILSMWLRASCMHGHAASRAAVRLRERS